MLARPAGSIATWKKSSSVRSPPLPACWSTRQVVPLLQTLPRCSTGVIARLLLTTFGCGLAPARATAPVSWVKATVQAVSFVPTWRYPVVSPPEAWYQTTSRLPAPPAAIQGKMSAVPPVLRAPASPGLITYGALQCWAPSVDTTYCTWLPSVQAAYTLPLASTETTRKIRSSSLRDSELVV